MRRIAIVLALGAMPALAQTPLPPSADPGRQEQRLAPPPPTRAAPPPIEVPGDTGVAPPGADQVRFQLNALELTGVSIYRPEDLQPLYRPLLGTEVTLEQVF